MPVPPESQPEHPSTYFVEDRSNRDELIRLQVQDQMFTASMGGVLPEQSTPTAFHRILDVGCGPGGWLIEAARTYPNLSVLIGVDTSRTMVESARKSAVAAGVADRVDFRTMDALRMLEFPRRYFDLVNHRFALGWLRTWDWRKLLQEYRQVTRSGGVVRVTENEIVPQSNSPALVHLCELMLQALNQAGHLFHPAADGVTGELGPLLIQHGLRQVQTRPYVLEYLAGTPAGDLYAQDVEHAFRTALPFLHKWVRVPDDYDALYQQMVREIRQPDFRATIGLLTAWGINPSGTRATDPLR